MRFLILSVFLLTQLFCAHGAKAEARSVKGIYRNPAEGYSIRIPKGLEAIAGDQAGPERGVSIHLPSGGEILSIGEPNSAEYKNPKEGVQRGLTFFKDCQQSQGMVTHARVGKLNGAIGRLVCGNHVYLVMLAFRPRGGPIYWLHLRTDLAHENEDRSILQSVASSFKIIRWQ